MPRARRNPTLCLVVQRSPYACLMSAGSCPTVINRTIIHNGLRKQGIEVVAIVAIRYVLDAAPIAAHVEAKGRVGAQRHYCRSESVLVAVSSAAGSV